MCDSSYAYEAEIRSSKNASLDKVSALWIRLPLKELSDHYKSKGHDELMKDLLKSTPGLVATIPRVKQNVPIYVLFGALGFSTDKDIWEALGVPGDDTMFIELLKNSLPRHRQVRTKDAALEFIGKL